MQITPLHRTPLRNNQGTAEAVGWHQMSARYVAAKRDAVHREIMQRLGKLAIIVSKLARTRLRCDEKLECHSPVSVILVGIPDPSVASYREAIWHFPDAEQAAGRALILRGSTLPI
jgi:hypothetical protein